jgi:menaquinone-specific isochorismate synthase
VLGRVPSLGLAIVTSMPLAVAAPRLVSRTVEIEAVDDLMAVLPPGEPPVSWIRRGDGLVGWGVAATLRTSGPDRFTEAARWFDDVAEVAGVRDDVRLPGSGLVAFGSFAFDDSASPRPVGSAVSLLTIPRVVVGRHDGRSFVTTISSSPELPSPYRIRRQPVPQAPVDVVVTDGAISGAAWMDKVAAAVARIATTEELGKVVLARDLLATAAGSVDLRWPIGRLATDYRDCWTFCVDGLVGATPELLVRRERGLVTSRVLAGTIRRTGDDEHDLALAASLARSSKDLEEHEFAAASLAEALAPFCTAMNVPETPFVLHLPNLMHLATEVTGVLAPDSPSSLEIAGALHPTAAVCGTPTEAARRLIAELEPIPRDRYAGPVGWLGADGDGEWGIALRCAQQQSDPSVLRLHVGCGIVAGSDPQAELAESIVKAQPVIAALQQP